MNLYTFHLSTIWLSLKKNNKNFVCPYTLFYKTFNSVVIEVQKGNGFNSFIVDKKD